MAIATDPSLVEAQHDRSPPWIVAGFVAASAATTLFFFTGTFSDVLAVGVMLIVLAAWMSFFLWRIVKALEAIRRRE